MVTTFCKVVRCWPECPCTQLVLAAAAQLFLSAGQPDQGCAFLQMAAAQQPKAARQSVPVQSRKPAQVSPPHPQPLSKRLGPQPAALRRPIQKPATDQVGGCPAAHMHSVTVPLVDMTLW